MRRILILISLLLTTQLHGLAQENHNKRALVICVTEQEDKSWGAINTSNDLHYVKSLLESSGYNDAAFLVGKNATKEGIVKAFRSLAERCLPGDLVYVHFSGHGQRVTDLDGDEELEKKGDKFDESWVPYDAYQEYCEHDKGEKHLIDDEVAQLLSDVKSKIGTSGHILVVVDACHSRGSTRGTSDESKFEPDEAPVRGVEKKFIIPYAGKYKEQCKVRVEEDWLTLSACADYEPNYECRDSDGKFVGKLTFLMYMLQNELKEATNDALVDAISKRMNGGEYKSPKEQNPSLTGRGADLKIFF